MGDNRETFIGDYLLLVLVCTDGLAVALEGSDGSDAVSETGEGRLSAWLRAPGDWGTPSFSPTSSAILHLRRVEYFDWIRR